MRPLCFVLMPFGTKHDPSGRPDIDFDRVYTQAIEPAIRDADIDPIRADAERTGGFIHTAMFERLLLSDFALADLTTANPNVFYELGVRHAVRPSTTVTIFAKHHSLPFDVALLRALPYAMGDDNRFGLDEAAALRAALAQRLREVRSISHTTLPVDSPLFQLLEGYGSPDLARLRTDLVRDRIRAGEEIRGRLTAARCLEGDQGASSIAEVERDIGPLDAVEAGVAVDLFLSYRAVAAYDRMIELFDRIPEVLRRAVLIREQLAFALNRRAGKDPARRADRQRAIDLLEGLLDERGPNAETCGLLGRIYKDQWEEARKAGDTLRARGHLKRAIETYVRGFEADWRDAYPGINAVTLLDIDGSKASIAQRDRLLPVVRFAVEQRLRGTEPDYWDHATLLGLSVLAGRQEEAEEHLASALTAVREVWEPETTARDLRLICDARAARQEDVGWMEGVIGALSKG